MPVLPLRVEDLAGLAGETVYDEYERSVGVLVSFQSDVDGVVEAIEVKVADMTVQLVPAGRVRISDGKVVVTPEWKYEAIKVIEALDRAYRRKRALETLAQQGEIPGDVLKGMQLKLDRDIKELKKRAERARENVKRRLAEISDEDLRIARAIANLQMLYFSSEIGDKEYGRALNSLRRLRESLRAEKADAKRILDKLEKTLEAATHPAAVAVKAEKHKQPAPPPPAHAPTAPRAEDLVLVKVED